MDRISDYDFTKFSTALLYLEVVFILESGNCLANLLLSTILFLKEFFTGVAARSHGVMVSTLDSESSDPSSNLGGTFPFKSFTQILNDLTTHLKYDFYEFICLGHMV